MDLPKDYLERQYGSANIRYHDTSLVIFRKWLESQEKYAFPTLYRFKWNRKRSEQTSEVDRYNLTDSECAYSSGNSKKVDKNHNDDDRNIRRRTKSLERTNSQDPPHSVKFEELKINKATDNNSNNKSSTLLLIEGNVKLHIIEPNGKTIGGDQSSMINKHGLITEPSHVIADVHRRPDSELLVISDLNNTKDNVPESIKKQTTNNDIRNSIQCNVSDKSFGTRTAGSAYSNRLINRDIASGIVYTHSNTPLIGDFDIDTTDYARVNLRRMKSHDVPSDEQQQHIIPKSQSFPIQSKRHPQSTDSLRLHYVTQRILASVLPRREPENGQVEGSLIAYGDFEDKHEKEIISMLEQKHGKNYRVFDLESCISIVTLERICELCKHIDSWLGGGQERVVVLQDRDDKQRLGTAIAAYLEYLDICSTNYIIRKGTSNEDLRVQNTIARNWLDLDIFAMKKFLEDFIGPLRIPSHKRYLRYFSGLLSGQIRMNSSPLYLKYIMLESQPSSLQYSQLIAQNSDWVTFIKIYEGLRCVFISDIHIIPITTQQFLYKIGGLRLRGDILIRCYHIISPTNGYSMETRELLFSMQFHTCAITSKHVIFGRNDLDLACNDPRFPSDHKVTLHFNSGGSNENGMVFQSPLVRTEPPNQLAKYDSVENFDIDSSYHTQGPLDGSLYATILKSPKSPQIPYPFPTTYPSLTSSHHGESVGQNLISPPPQFSNKQQTCELVERRLSSITPSRDTVDGPTATRQKLQNSNITGSQINNPKSNYTSNYVEIRPSTSQSNYRDSNKYPISVNLNNHHYPPEIRQITIVETYNSTTDGQNYPNGGRESVRSPLTLSMDSGISSSGVLNRPQQGSSVSPSSFPSQASPQEDRQKELDDILSDMLMTVQDIPDLSKAPSRQNQYQNVRNQSGIPISENYISARPYSNHQQLELYNTVKRPQSYLVVQETTSQNPYLAKDRHEFYDTSSTTTTLTPPLSESGRETPIAVYSSTGTNSNISTLQHRQTLQRDESETFLTAANQPLQRIQHQQQLIMNLQHQSSAYPQPVRIETAVLESEIPYHAREHSQPFSYGTVPANSFRSESPIDPAMIKMQSGLSSPSLVRKTLGRGPSPTTPRKTVPRNDFEEMLRDRREKVLSEKYSISDRATTNNTPDIIERQSYGSENNWVNSSSANQYRHNRSNGYRQYNNDWMDGGFVRSNSTDGISGQTWLQLQQQKLRAKKNQQDRDDRRYFEQVIHTEIRNRPVRSRVTNGQRYDGYSSDTAAFTDEVDFRRPLHIQTPSIVNRSHDRSDHTLTSTTTTVTQKERPFVAIKRAHERAKQNSMESPQMSPLSILNASPNGHITQAQQQNGLLSMADNSRNGHVQLVREESFSSYRSETEPEISIAGSPRPETPAFPVTPRTPYGFTTNGNVSPALPPKSPTSQRKDLYSGNQKGHINEVVNQNETISCYASRRNSNTSNANSEPQEVAPHLVKFVRDSSKYWYKPNISREEAVSLLRNAEPGTFIVRDSTTFKNAFGLVLRVAHPPPGVQMKGPPGDELVRHFLVEPTSRGVRLKGCANEPVFSSLSALVYQHSIMPLALPCRLIIPDRDIQALETPSPVLRHLLAQGAACNVLYLYTCDTESLTGEEAVRKAVSQLFSYKPLPMPTEVHIKVANQGITLTDNTRQKFFRKHYAANHVSFCGLDPQKRTWSIAAPGADIPVNNKTIFAFVARRSASSKDNQCHVFCDLQSNQPALAIVAFANKMLPTEKLVNQHI